MENAESSYRNGDYAASAALLAPLVERTAPLPAALRVLGLCRLRLGAPAQALDLLARAHLLAPRDPWAKLHHAIGLQAVGRHAEAMPLLCAARSLLPADPAPSLNLSTSWLAVGDVPRAIEAAREGIARAPAMPQAHYVLGAACLADNRLTEAAGAFARAVELAPGFVEAWISLGVCRYRNSEPASAIDAMRAALTIKPHNATARNNLGVFLRLAGDTEAGETLLRETADMHADAPAARINLAANLLQEDRAAAALSLLAGPPPADQSTLQHWRLQQILALIKLGRLEEARAFLGALGAVPPALAPMTQWRQALLALAEGDVAAAERHAAAMAETLAGSDAVLPEHRIMGHYDLAKLWSQLEQPDRAFPHWTLGHRQLARFQPFSRDACEAFVDAAIASFSAARLSAGARAANHDRTPVFIVGMPRSGTTLIEQILDAHAEVHGAGERPALGRLFARLGGAAETAAAAARVADLNGAELNTQAARYLAELHRLDPAASRIADKMPGNFRHLGLAALLLPGARIIACDRDPRDIGLSIFTYRFYGVHAYAHDLGDLGWYIGQHLRLMAHWRAVLPNPMMTVRLQDVVEDFPGTLRRLLDFLGLPYDPRCERFHEGRRRVRTVSRSQVREKINARGLGRWRAYERHLGPLIAALRESGALDDLAE